MIRDERGMTLTELLLFLAIIGLMTGTLVTAIYQINQVTGWGGNQMRVQHDLQNAATWLNRDVLSASRAEVSGSQMVLRIPYFAGTILTRTITYTHSAPHLIRYSGDSTVITVASHVGSVAFSPTSPVVTSAITITITSWASNVAQSTTLHLDMRPTE